jgi:hypothetical protein
MLLKPLNSLGALLGLQLLSSGKKEIPWVSPYTNTMMSSPRLLIYFFTHLQFLQILLSWYETWGSKNIFLPMQIYFKFIWRRRLRLPKCWQLIILSAWALRLQCADPSSKMAHENSSLSFHMLLSLPPSGPSKVIDRNGEK